MSCFSRKHIFNGPRDLLSLLLTHSKHQQEEKINKIGQGKRNGESKN